MLRCCGLLEKKVSKYKAEQSDERRLKSKRRLSHRPGQRSSAGNNDETEAWI